MLPNDCYGLDIIQSTLGMTQRQTRLLSQKSLNPRKEGGASLKSGCLCLALVYFFPGFGLPCTTLPVHSLFSEWPCPRQGLTLFFFFFLSWVRPVGGQSDPAAYC